MLLVFTLAPTVHPVEVDLVETPAAAVQDQLSAHRQVVPTAVAAAEQKYLMKTDQVAEVP